MIQINNYGDCIELQEYKGKWSVVKGYKKNDGSFGVRFNEIVGKDGAKKFVPEKWLFDTKERAITTFYTLAAIAEGKPVPTDLPEEETPF